MKVLSLPLLLTLSVASSAQTAQAIYHRACGPENASFQLQHVKTNPPAAPEPGKALVFFIQKKQSSIKFMIRIGVDGAWAGVVEGDSYISANVAPGEHHACAATMGLKHPQAELLHFTAEPGKTYYFLVRASAAEGKFSDFFSMPLTPVDRDEALYLIASDPTTTATPKP
jgi:hypothetical protein